MFAGAGALSASGFAASFAACGDDAGEADAVVDCAGGGAAGTTIQITRAAAAAVNGASHATRDNRAILTFNAKDFARLHDSWQEEKRSHGGIILSRQIGNRQ